MREFKVGDRVRVDNPVSAKTAMRGWTGTVVRVGLVEEPDCIAFDVDGTYEMRWAYTWELTLLDDETAVEHPAIDPYRGSDLEREREIAAKMLGHNAMYRGARSRELAADYVEWAEQRPLPSLADFNPRRWPGRNHLDLTDRAPGVDRGDDID